MKYQKRIGVNRKSISGLKSDDEVGDELTEQNVNDINITPSIVCSNCGALYANGEWTWNALPNDHIKGVCPSCKRIEDHDPAASVIIKGTYFAGHKDEINHLVKNISKSELSDHPLERLMDIKDGASETEFTTTGIHLARRIGYALQLAYDGELRSVQSDNDHIIVYWEKDL
ncbi:MAG: ATPase [Gracilimonas sp.]|uniref:BCAM0308 family protein n=1 Tax=Gracilimonas sp. TaxID=1974203 RepID=UPI0019B23705|nr:BCAM0308 family protein [Gracilimonas sp.]MBD3616321.1 ATPase [Gracilimonas sp.]